MLWIKTLVEIIINTGIGYTIFCLIQRWTLQFNCPSVTANTVYNGIRDPKDLLVPTNYLTNNFINQRRLNKSREWLKHVNLLLPNKTETTKNTSRLTISIVASKRPNFELTQLVAHLLMFMKLFPEKYFLLICNTDISEQRPTEIIGVPVIDLKDISNQFDKEPWTLNDRIHKESLDYWQCLNVSATKFPSNYTLLIEDDAIPIDGFDKAILSLIKQLDKLANVDYVKLYHAWSLRGIPSIVQIFSDAYYILTDGEVKLSIPESCCTQAVLFRNTRISEIVHEFEAENARAGHAKDHILDESRFHGRATDTNFVVHIGYYSILRKKIVF